MMRKSLALLCFAAVSQAAGAAVVTTHKLALADAQKLATETVAACQAQGYAVSAAVVDGSGQLQAFARADNAGPHTIESARQKAFTSASARNNTQAMMEGAQKNPGAANLVHLPGFLLLGGGVPVRAGDEVVGAVGVGGAPGGHLDEQCAVAALDAVKDQLK